VVSFVCSLPRTFDALSKLATVSAFFTFVGVILAAAFAGAEGKHGTAGYTAVPSHTNSLGVFVPGGEPLVLVVPAAGTTFVAGMNAFLNISYTFIGQITLPSFIAEMKNPYDFRKCIYIVTIAEVILFSLVGGIGTSPARSDRILLIGCSIWIYGNSVQYSPRVWFTRQRCL